jgi:hypothetical protein
VQRPECQSDEDENVASFFRQRRPLSPQWTSHSICRTRQSLIRTARVSPYGRCSISEMMPGHPRPRINLKAVGIVCSYNARLMQLPLPSVLHQCLTYVSPQAGDVSLLETILQEFTVFERLPVTVTEAGLLRDIQIHLPVNESYLSPSRRADSRSTQASTGSVF